MPAKIIKRLIRNKAYVIKRLKKSMKALLFDNFYLIFEILIVILRPDWRKMDWI